MRFKNKTTFSSYFWLTFLMWILNRYSIRCLNPLTTFWQKLSILNTKHENCFSNSLEIH